MKQKTAILSIVLGLTLVFAGFFVGKASATTGCFSDSNSHWAEVSICWLKDYGISSGYVDGTYHPDSPITRAEMAIMLQKIDYLTLSQTAAAFSGPIQVVMAPSEWFSTSSGVTTTPDYTETDFKKSTTGIGYIKANVTVPVALFGRSLQFTGIEICYDATNTPIDNIYVYRDEQTAGVGTTYTTVFSDSDNKTNAACSYYSTTPTTLTPDSIINLRIDGNWASAGTILKLGRVTLILTPTIIIAPSPLVPSFEVPGQNFEPKP